VVEHWSWPSVAQRLLDLVPAADRPGRTG
jgi:hypothetical protein